MSALTPELFWLALTAILAGSLWFPYVVMSSSGSNKQYTSFDRLPRIDEMSDMTQRSWRAHSSRGAAATSRWGPRGREAPRAGPRGTASTSSLKQTNFKVI